MAQPIVLVIEDDDDLRQLFATVLRFGGFQVAEAADGLAALKAIDEIKPDAIVLDLVLPRITGYGVLYDLSTHARTRNIPVIVVTATEDKFDRFNVACVLRKPITPEFLVKHVRRCIDGSP